MVSPITQAELGAGPRYLGLTANAPDVGEGWLRVNDGYQRVTDEPARQRIEKCVWAPAARVWLLYEIVYASSARCDVGTDWFAAEERAKR